MNMPATRFDPRAAQNGRNFARPERMRSLSRQEEIEAFAQLQTGDEQAREKIICANLLFVRRVAYTSTSPSGSQGI